MVKASSQKPTATVDAKAKFNGVKVFSATMVAQRDQLGEVVSKWIAAHPEHGIVDMVVAQSSDSAFHCISISVFYDEHRDA